MAKAIERIWLERAWVDTLGLLGKTVPGLCFAFGSLVFAVVCLLVFASKEAALEQVVAFLYGALGPGLLLFVWNYCQAPERLMREQENEIVKLKDRLTPKYKLSVGTAQTYANGPSGRVEIRYINVKVANQADTSLKECRAELSGIFVNGKSHPKFEASSPLNWNDPSSPSQTVINGRGEKVVHVATAGSQGHSLRLDGIQYNRYEGIFDSPATYGFKVSVSCGDIPDEIRFDVVWNGRWDEMIVREVSDVSR